MVVKLESANPTGSMKDRVARAMIEAAITDRRLSPGDTVVEYTAGTTGISLALVCAALGLKAHFVFSDAFSEDKRHTMRAYGAAITDVPSEQGKITEKLIKALISTADDLSRRPGHWYCDQLNNRDGEAGYHALGEELWQQSGGAVDAFVQSVGTAHSLHGSTHALRRHNPRLRIVAVEPAESPVLSGRQRAALITSTASASASCRRCGDAEVDEILTVPTAEAKAMARRLAREEAIFAGTSTGANVVAALRVAERLPAGATVATIAVDSGLRYLSTDLYRD